MAMANDESAIRDLLEQRARATTAKNAEASVSARAPDIVAYDIAPPSRSVAAQRPIPMPPGNGLRPGMARSATTSRI